jgi:predicted nucleic acid-binding protein
MILDTNAVSALLGGDASIEDMLSNAEMHHLPVVVIGEYLFGLFASVDRRRLISLFQKLIGESFLLDVDLHTGETYAQIRFELKQKGRPLPGNDIWIAALARQHNLTVISRDLHFDVIDGIRRMSW